MAEILNQEVYEGLAAQIKGMKENLVRAKDLRDALKEAQEDTTELDIQIRDIEQKVGRWQAVLKRRGYLD